MGANFARYFVEAAGNTILADHWNGEFDNILTNFTPAGMDDASTNLTAFQTTVDPGELGSESLPTDLAGEIQRLRYALKDIKGVANWYPTPAASMAAHDTSIATKATGAASSTDNAIARFDSTTGKLLQNSTAIVDDSGNLSGTPTVTVSTNLSAASAPTANKIYANNIVKAWATLTCGAAGAVTVTDGFNVNTASYATSNLTVNFHTNLANTTYVAFASVMLAAFVGGSDTTLNGAQIKTKNVGSLVVCASDNSGSGQSIGPHTIANGDVFHIMVIGVQ